MKTKIPYSPPSMAVMKLTMDRCICQGSSVQTINQLMLWDALMYEDGSWDAETWDYNGGGH